jgi:hypothetical protein
MKLARINFALLLFAITVLFSACTCEGCVRLEGAPATLTELAVSTGDGELRIAFTMPEDASTPITNVE